MYSTFARCFARLSSRGAKLRVWSRSMQGEPTPKETARRVRAALAYAGIDVKDTDEKVGITTATMARIVSQTKPRGFQKAGELEKVAGACEVPEDFLRYGWAREDPDILGRLSKLESEMDAVLKRLVAEAPPPPPGVYPHPQTDGRSNESTAQQPQIPVVPDDRRGTER